MASETKGYWLVSAVITDPTKFQGYTEVAEGTPAGRPFVIEFPSFQAAKDCYASDGYQAAIALREGAATLDIIIAQGAPPAA